MLLGGEMGIKGHIGIVVGFLMLLCNTALAGLIYNVDPTQSYVKAYVPSWVINPNYGSITLTSDGDFISTPGWQLEWNLTAFSLSGSFDGSVEPSPWVPGIARFGISRQDYKLDASISAAVNLPSSLTFYQSSGDIVYSNSPCSWDLFYPAPGPGWHCSGISTGDGPQFWGIFDGKTLDIQGDSGGFPLLYLGNCCVETPPPLDPAPFTPQYFTYRIVATSIPEPGTLPLIFLGIAALYQASRRKIRN